MFKILTLIVLGYFAYKVFLGPDTTTKIERNPRKKNIKPNEPDNDDFVDYEEID